MSLCVKKCPYTQMVQHKNAAVKPTISVIFGYKNIFQSDPSLSRQAETYLEDSDVTNYF